MASINIFHSQISKLSLQNELTVIEIGSRFGESLEFLLGNFRIKKITSIDPFEVYQEFEKATSPMHDIDTNNLYSTLLEKFKNDPVNFIRKKSDDAHHLIENLSTDLIFVDGNHSYDFVYNDIKNFLPKLKNGGIICGDDYFMKKADSLLPNGEIDGYPDKMVFEAVNEFFKNNNEEFETVGYPHWKGISKGWMFRKTNDKTIYI